MIFLDNASTTKMSDNAITEFVRVNQQTPYNPSAQYVLGINAHKVICNAKEEILKMLYGDGNVIFTGSATESNNQVLSSFASKKGKILISAGEHPSVYNVAKEFEQKGYNTSVVKLDKITGQVNIEDFMEKMTPDVNFISIIHVSNETGAINDIKSLVEIAKSVNPKVVFHSDGVQAFGKILVDVTDLDIDLYTISAHKICGPKGVGALYVRKGLALKPFIIGGGQELGLRSGTENTAGIASFVIAAKEKAENTKIIMKNLEYVQKLSDTLKKQASAMFPKFSINGSGSPYVISCRFGDMRGETLLHALETKQIFIGNGSACSSKKAENRVLMEMGIDQKDREKSVRISFSTDNTVKEVKYLVDEIKEILG